MSRAQTRPVAMRGPAKSRLEPSAMASLPPAQLRQLIRAGEYCGITSGLAPGVAQGNLAVVPNTLADAFEAFCRANPAALPLIERGEPGDPMLRCAANFDVRTDLGGYLVWTNGQPGPVQTDIAEHWHSGLTAFVLGCWFAAEAALDAAGVRMRHVEEGVQGGLFRTTLPNAPAGPFAVQIVVSTRPFARHDADRVVAITARLPTAHGAPVNVGSPEAIGIHNLSKPDFGEPLPPSANEVAISWACGLTGQEALVDAGLPYFITHQPGCMVVTDIPVGAPPS